MMLSGDDGGGVGAALINEAMPQERCSSTSRETMALESDVPIA
jgi:hypothetical protein